MNKTTTTVDPASESPAVPATGVEPTGRAMVEPDARSDDWVPATWGKATTSPASPPVTRTRAADPASGGPEGPGAPAPRPDAEQDGPPAGAAPPRRDENASVTAPVAPLDERSMVRERADRPTHGWRSALFRMSGGGLNPGLSGAERARNEILARIRRPLRGTHRIAVASIKGGVGKTTVAACLGLVLAEHRGDRVIALDANPDAGTLGDRLTGETAVNIRDMIDNLGALDSLTDVSRYTSLAGRLHVLASEQEPAASEALSRSEYEQVSAVLTRFYNIGITDSGTGLVHEAMQGTLGLTDTLVVVGAPTVDGASRTKKMLDWLVAHGHGDKVDRALVVLSWDRSSRDVDADKIRTYFASRCREVVEVPFDPHLATGGRIDLSLLGPSTVEAFRMLAAHVADGFDPEG